MKEQKCWNCKDGTVMWAGDSECDPEDQHEVVTTMICLSCDAAYLVHWGGNDGDQDNSG